MECERCRDLERELRELRVDYMMLEIRSKKEIGALEATIEKIRRAWREEQSYYYGDSDLPDGYC
jgi:hypothetical protein